MILNTIVLVGLLAASATGSAIKGREEYSTKGGRQVLAPVEYQRAHYEQREAYAAKGQEALAPAPEQAKLADSELYQQREEVKSERQQFYDAQPQLREPECKGDWCKKPALPSKTEERVEEQTRLAQLPEQTRYEDYSQQREEAPAKGQELKGAVKAPELPSQTKETKQQYYEAKPQVREEQYVAQAPVEQAKLEEVQRGEEVKGQKYEAQREELKASKTFQRVEEHKFDQQDAQLQQVELAKQDYEQRRLEEQTEQRSDEQISQVREEGQLKGGLRPAGAEAEPYAFDYSVEGSSRRESGDQHGVVRGQYTIQGADGSQRIVDYVADRDGFRAQVQTNEFGTESQQPANVALRSSQPSAEGIALRLEGKTREAPVQQQVYAAVKTAPQPVAQFAEIARTRAYEESRAYKGAPLVAAPIKEAPVAEHRTLVQEAPAPVYQQRALEPIKSAELKSAPIPRAPAAQLKTGSLLARASGFESATAHRPVVATRPYVSNVVRHVPVLQSVPVQPVRHQVLVPVRASAQPHHHQHHHHPQPVLVGPVSRSQLQHDRYPSVSYRREQPLNPRVSFYANNDEEHSVGFEHPADLV